MKKSLVLTLFLLFLANAAAASEILVSAASDLTGAFKDIGAMYEKESGNRVVLNFGSTGILAQQIEGGAPVDLFAAANRSYVDKLEKKGLIAPDTKKVYAVGRIALASSKGGVAISSMNDLLNPRVKRIAIANPSHAPYGMAAKEAMEKAGVWEKVKDRVVFGENIRQALQYLETGNVDTAIVALSLCNTPDMNCSLVPQELHAPIEQTMAVIKGSGNEQAARGLADFIVGPRGREVMGRYGFGIPDKKR